MLDPKALADEGLSAASPVSLVVRDVKLKTALKLMLQPLGLTYKLEDDVILITSPLATQAQTYTHTYYVGDLVLPADHGPQSLLPHMTLNKEQSPQHDPNAGFGPTTDPMQPAGFSGVRTATGERPNVDMTPIIQLITTSIAPGTWKLQDGQDGSAYGLGGGFGGDAGGIDQQRQPGAIVPFYLSISLIIKHTAEVHDQVADLLRQLRRLTDLQVSIEVRFITVSDTFFEFIGVDFDFEIQSDSVGKHSTFATVANTSSSSTTSTSTSSSSSTSGTSTTSTSTSTSSSSSTSGTSTSTSSSTGSSTSTSSSSSTGSSSTGAPASYTVSNILDHSLPNTQPVIVGLSTPGLNGYSSNLALPYTGPTSSSVAPSQYTSGTGATFGIAFLSDLEVFLYLTAAQGDSRANVLQAPKVTTMNGAAATVMSTQTTYYVQSLTPIIGPGAVAYTPNIAPLNQGPILMVTPVVSADRRYVRMTLSPQFISNATLQTFAFPSLAAVGGSGLGGAAAVVAPTIQLPNFTLFTVSTTVTVPDGGTVLMGGVKTMNETRTENGVPVLSKIPMIDRLFRNIGIGRTTSSLMLMVTPRIIILEEEEQALGIPSVAF